MLGLWLTQKSSMLGEGTGGHCLDVSSPTPHVSGLWGQDHPAPHGEPGCNYTRSCQSGICSTSLMCKWLNNLIRWNEVHLQAQMLTSDRDNVVCGNISLVFLKMFIFNCRPRKWGTRTGEKDGREFFFKGKNVYHILTNWWRKPFLNHFKMLEGTNFLIPVNIPVKS